MNQDFLEENGKMISDGDETMVVIGITAQARRQEDNSPKLNNGKYPQLS